MRRTDSRPTSGERSQTPPGGEVNGGEGRESFSANAQHDGAGTASSNVVAELAEVLRQALQMANERGPTIPTDLLRRAANELEHIDDFHEYADRFPGGRGHERNRHHPSGGRGRGRGGGFGQLPPPNSPPNLPPNLPLG